MNRRWCGRMVIAACGIMVMCAPAWGAVVLQEYNGHYYNPNNPNDPNNTYWVVWDVDIPRITILKQSGELPFDFECRDTGTGREAPIGAIVGDDDLDGLVELMVRGHGERAFGALDVWRLQLDPNNVDGRLLEFTVSGQVGYTDPNDPNTTYPTHFRAIAGALSANRLGSSLDVLTISQSGSLDLPLANTSIHVGGSLEGSVTVTTLSADMDVDGSVNGSIEVGTLSADLNVDGSVNGTGSIEVAMLSADIDVGGMDGSITIQAFDEVAARTIHVHGSMTGDIVIWGGT